MKFLDLKGLAAVKNWISTNFLQTTAITEHVINENVSASDNGKILMVVNGQWQLVSPSVLYTGSGIPNNANGNNGDLYTQTD